MLRGTVWGVVGMLATEDVAPEEVLTALRVNAFSVGCQLSGHKKAILPSINSIK